MILIHPPNKTTFNYIIIGAVIKARGQLCILLFIFYQALQIFIEQLE